MSRLSCERKNPPSERDESGERREEPMAESTHTEQEHTTLIRAIRWSDAFWIASGVPALLVFSVGYIAVLTGPVSVAIWIVSILIGIAMAFVYAEMAGMFPEEAGGPPVFGAHAGKGFGGSPVVGLGGRLMGSSVQPGGASGRPWSRVWSPTADFGIHFNFAYV